MPKKPKDDCKQPDESVESTEEGAWSEDQKVRSYYYDDAHGYEIYHPDEEEDAEDAEARNAEARA